MGMDYRYLLFFEREACLDVLERLADIAVPGSYEPATLVLPDRTVPLQFSGWLETGPRIAWDDPSPSWDFMTVLCFEPDEAIEYYLERVSPPSDKDLAAGSADDRYDERGRAKVGFVYLSVHRDMTNWPSETGEDLVLFEFGTPGSSMSVLFWESESIHRAFTRLLESCRGVYGLLDMEDKADLIWLRGEERSDRLPTAEIPLAEIERLVGAATPSAGVPSRLEEMSAPDDRTPSSGTPATSNRDALWRRALHRILVWLPGSSRK